MEIYNYEQQVTKDLINYLKENHPEINNVFIHSYSYDDVHDQLYNLSFAVDCITGNGSGSYTFNTIQAEQNPVGNWNLLREARKELAPDVNVLEKGAEYCDVLIRIHMLSKAIDNAISEL